ncbi:C-type lectin domain family 4 member E-like [Brienomyrus brachyistius]|uniref:C-type lectin domain family 4 member E-like n=1 Tax=Brienomyrus brachyistius TaxID=42636 RepID=UPI0020B1D1F7|nr:C-type lectin domain family 4 member E-like [Brienomyrus brachyistius]
MESQVDCRQKGADLVVIDSKEEQTFFSQYQRTWIGLTDKKQEGVFKWVNGTPLTTSYWMNGEPNDEGGNEDCVEIINFSGTIANWNDRPCYYEEKWICEREGLD